MVSFRRWPFSSSVSSRGGPADTPPLSLCPAAAVALDMAILSDASCAGGRVGNSIPHVGQYRSAPREKFNKYKTETVRPERRDVANR